MRTRARLLFSSADKCREVEDFARRLNSDWPERVQEILSLGEDTRTGSNLINGNGSARKYTDTGQVGFFFFFMLSSCSLAQ